MDVFRFSLKLNRFQIREFLVLEKAFLKLFQGKRRPSVNVFSGSNKIFLNVGTGGF